jgi:hypothetical protein
MSCLLESYGKRDSFECSKGIFHEVYTTGLVIEYDPTGYDPMNLTAYVGNFL